MLVRHVLYQLSYAPDYSRTRDDFHIILDPGPFVNKKIKISLWFFLSL